MSVRYGTSDAFAVVSTVYVCGCGRTAEQHGLEAGQPPPGWVPVPDEDEPEYLCPDCAPAADS